MRQLMVVVEGMDNTGKTTLMKKLESLMGISGHMSNGRPHSIEEMFTRMEGYLSQPGISLHDRIHCISDQIYGPIVRKENPFLTPRGGRIFQEFKKIKPVIIYARPPREMIFDFGTRDQMPGVIDNSVRLLNAYDELIQNMIHEGFDILVYDYTDKLSYQELQEYIIERMEKFHG